MLGIFFGWLVTIGKPPIMTRNSEKLILPSPFLGKEY